MAVLIGSPFSARSFKFHVATPWLQIVYILILPGFGIISTSTRNLYTDVRYCCLRLFSALGKYEPSTLKFLALFSVYGKLTYIGISGFSSLKRKDSQESPLNWNMCLSFIVRLRVDAWNISLPLQLVQLLRK